MSLARPIGVITVAGQQVGVITWGQGAVLDPFNPMLDGYEPLGRAVERPLGGAEMPHWGGHHPHGPHHHRSHGNAPAGGAAEAPSHHAALPPVDGKSDEIAPHSQVQRGSHDTDQAIRDASKAYNLDPNLMRSIASIESGMNPGSNANKKTQYKGLYQIGRDEWKRFGGEGNIYSARDNAFAAAHMFDVNRKMFHQKFGRDPNDTELYLMHQQGLGFYTKGITTNLAGNQPPGGSHDAASHEAGWGREVARRKAGFAAHEPKLAFDPATQPL